MSRQKCAGRQTHVGIDGQTETHTDIQTDRHTESGLEQAERYAKASKGAVLTSGSGQHYSGAFVVSGDVLHQVSSVDGPARM